MAYNSDKLRCVLTLGVASAPKFWVYSATGDVHGTISDANYFTDGYKKGMRVGDVVWVHDSNTPSWTQHYVVSSTATGNSGADSVDLTSPLVLTASNGG